MSSPEHTLDWNHARALAALAEAGTLSAAAELLGTTQPTVGRQIAALEEALAVSLIERVGRTVALTDAGLALAEQAQGMAANARRLSRIASGRSTALEGDVTVSASEVISAHLLPPALATIRATYPGIRVAIVASNQATDLRRRVADIAVRNFRPTDEELIASALPSHGARFYATPGYLNALGRPAPTDDLSGVEFVGFDRSPVFAERLAMLGMHVSERQFRFVSENQLVQWELVKAGGAMGVMMEAVGDAEPSVERAFGDAVAIPVPMWLTTHREVRTSRRVRAVFDVISAHLRGAERND